MHSWCSTAVREWISRLCVCVPWKVHRLEVYRWIHRYLCVHYRFTYKGSQQPYGATAKSLLSLSYAPTSDSFPPPVISLLPRYMHLDSLTALYTLITLLVYARGWTRVRCTRERGPIGTPKRLEHLEHHFRRTSGDSTFSCRLEDQPWVVERSSLGCDTVF